MSSSVSDQPQSATTTLVRNTWSSRHFRSLVESGSGRLGRLSAQSALRGGPADVAQLVEHHLAKVRVAGSNPVVRSTPSSAPHAHVSGLMNAVTDCEFLPRSIPHLGGSGTFRVGRSSAWGRAVVDGHVHVVLAQFALRPLDPGQVQPSIGDSAGRDEPASIEPSPPQLADLDTDFVGVHRGGDR